MSEKRLSSAMDIAGGPHSAGWRQTVNLDCFWVDRASVEGASNLRKANIGPAKFTDDAGWDRSERSPKLLSRPKATMSQRFRR
jgi:hypothetical protein